MGCAMDIFKDIFFKKRLSFFVDFNYHLCLQLIPVKLEKFKLIIFVTLKTFRSSFSFPDLNFFKNFLCNIN